MMLSRKHLNENLLRAEYAVRGSIVLRAQELELQGKKIIYCNIGNPQALGQRPLTYLRQILSLIEYPELMKQQATDVLYPKDVLAKAQSILERHPHGSGAYTQSTGIPFIREAVAQFIRDRDGIPADSDRVILTDGASKGAQAVLLALLRERNDGFMIPIPQYPLYSASIAMYSGKQIGYYLDEANRWQLNEAALTESLHESKPQGIHPVGIAVINPGNPTGAVLSYDNIKMVIQFARRHDLCIIADEVYQENVYDPDSKFYSFAKVMHDLDVKDVPLFSLHSASKGFLGECGHRGGYLELRNISSEISAEFVKLQSINLCANVVGQLTTYLMVSPPKMGEESYPLYIKEKNKILSALKNKAEILKIGINEVEGLSLDLPQGAMYAFVKVELPAEKGVNVEKMKEADRMQYEAQRDSDYCMSLLEETGICVVPGSGFGQLPGTFHFRTTFLPPQNEIEELVLKLKTFHENYVKKESVLS
jgi:aspartate/methionine/tyrosine aminotransferase